MNIYLQCHLTSAHLLLFKHVFHMSAVSSVFFSFSVLLRTGTGSVGRTSCTHNGYNMGSSVWQRLSKHAIFLQHFSPLWRLHQVSLFLFLHRSIQSRSTISRSRVYCRKAAVQASPSGPFEIMCVLSPISGSLIYYL